MVRKLIQYFTIFQFYRILLIMSYNIYQPIKNEIITDKVCI